MKKKMIFLLLVFLLFICGCSKDKIVQTENQEIGEEGKQDSVTEFQKAIFSEMNSSAKENGLGGTKVYINGLSKEKIEIDSGYGFILEDEEKNEWVILSEDNIYLEEKIIGNYVKIYGEYIGFSNVLNMPAINIDINGGKIELEEKPESEEIENISEKEIVFRDIPWGTNYETVEQTYGEMNWVTIYGEEFVTPSVDAVLLDNDYAGIDFENKDINIIASALNEETEVAGYTTSDIDLYFSYNVENGKILRTENGSSLYGAKYTIEPSDLESATADLIEKLSSLYGEPYKNSTDSDMFGNIMEYTYWKGANNTELVLKSQDSSSDESGIYSDKITISYAWRNGDNLLQEASDTIATEKGSDESSVYGNESVDGL